MFISYIGLLSIVAVGSIYLIYKYHFLIKERLKSVSDEAKLAKLRSQSKKVLKKIDETVPVECNLFEGPVYFKDGTMGISFENTLLPYLLKAKKIELVDPFIRLSHQGRNLIDLLAILAINKDKDETLDFILTTVRVNEEPGKSAQSDMLATIRQAAEETNINFQVIWDDTVHDRSIVTDTHWTIILGKGLDFFRRSSASQFDMASRHQEFRKTSDFNIIYLRTAPEATPDAHNIVLD